MSAILAEAHVPQADPPARSRLDVGDRLHVPSARARWAGRVISGVAVLFMAFDAVMKVFQVPAAVEGTTQLGYPASVLVGIGIVQVACLVVYLVQRTAPL